MTDITELARSLKAAADREMICRDGAETSEIWERTVTPENILALVEALEKAQKRIAELEQKHCGGAIMERELAHSEVINKLMSEIDNRDSRIAELESRSVKLPKKNIGWDRDEEDCWNNAIDACAEVLAAAGIKVEAE